MKIKHVPELVQLDLEVDGTRAWRGAAEKLQALAGQEVPKGVAVGVFVRQGHPHTEIINAAAELKADLIVISTHVYTGMKHVRYGSNTESLVRHACCPILVVRENEREFLA